MTEEIQPSDSPTVLVNRDLSNTLFISATVDGKSDIVSLPAAPKFTVKVKPIWNPPMEKPPLVNERSGGAGTTPWNTDLCVSPEPDAILLPSTRLFEKEGTNTGGGLLYDDKNASTLRVCVNVRNSTGSNEFQSIIQGRFQVWEAYLSPVPK